MFGWLNRRGKRLHPEGRWIVAIEPADLRVTDCGGRTTGLAKADLSGIAIETNDTGPWGEDLWWQLFGPDGQMACAFPQGAIGEEAAIDYLSSLPGFNHEQMTAAMCSTENARFEVWRKAT